MGYDSEDPAFKRPKISIVEIAESTVAKFPDSDIEIALDFLKETVPEFCKESNDRLVKVGRSIVSLISMKDEIPLEQSLELVVQECKLLVQEGGIKVPKVRFGKTELQMPIVTLGCMRFQQQWGDKVKNINQVYSDCQDNLVAILRRAILDFGINHIETARGYGCSELQLGVALKALFMNGEVKREDLIIQSKVTIMEDTNKFRSMLEQSFKNLQVDYLDLFAFHGFNGEWQWDSLFDGEDNCWNVIQEYKAAGKIRHIGFSSHAPTDFIYRAIETEKFDYVNLHHHFCGSYTASGDGPDGIGNIKCLRLMKKLDMGAFVISLSDKGGKIYAPSRKLRSLVLPDLEPMAYGSAWLWNLEEMDEEKAAVHTFSVGAARAVDLDQCAVAAYLQGKKEMLPKVKAASNRLEKAKVDALGQDWIDSCYQGIVKSNKSKYMVEHTQAIWIYNCIKAWGLHSFAKDRYKTLVNNRKKYDPSLSIDENIDKIGRMGWGYMPGLDPEADKDYFADDLSAVPEKNQVRVKEAYDFVRKWCTPKDEKSEGKAQKDEKSEELELVPPKEWETCYEMKPWKDFPDRPYP